MPFRKPIATWSEKLHTTSFTFRRVRRVVGVIEESLLFGVASEQHLHQFRESLGIPVIRAVRAVMSFFLVRYEHHVGRLFHASGNMAAIMGHFADHGQNLWNFGLWNVGLPHSVWHRQDQRATGCNLLGLAYQCKGSSPISPSFWGRFVFTVDVPWRFWKLFHCLDSGRLSLNYSQWHPGQLGAWGQTKLFLSPDVCQIFPITKRQSPQTICACVTLSNHSPHL